MCETEYGGWSADTELRHTKQEKSNYRFNILTRYPLNRMEQAESTQEHKKSCGDRQQQHGPSNAGDSSPTYHLQNVRYYKSANVATLTKTVLYI